MIGWKKVGKLTPVLILVSSNSRRVVDIPCYAFSQGQHNNETEQQK